MASSHLPPLAGQTQTARAAAPKGEDASVRRVGEKRKKKEKEKKRKKFFYSEYDLSLQCEQTAVLPVVADVTVW